MAAAVVSPLPGKPCHWHPGTPGVASCQICKRPVCARCKVTVTDGRQVFCKVHGLKGSRMQSKAAW
ncbi:MAG: hypothetical protein QXO51_03480 [Halobacteria archaeon]